MLSSAEFVVSTWSLTFLACLAAFLASASSATLSYSCSIDEEPVDLGRLYRNFKGEFYEIDPEAAFTPTYMKCSEDRCTTMFGVKMVCRQRNHMQLVMSRKFGADEIYQPHYLSLPHQCLCKPQRAKLYRGNPCTTFDC